MKFALGLTLCAALFAAATSASAAVLTVDNFEGYTSGTAIATSSTSTPWLRFGSVADNLYASSSATSLLDGTLSGRIPVAITTATGSATVRRNYGSATDLSGYATATVLTKSLAATASTAVLQLSVSNGPTSYVSTVPLPETTTAQTLTFPLAPAAFTLAGGTDSLATVLASATSIGFRIASTTGSTSETLAFDDFTLQTAVPEPTTLGLVSAGVATLLGRRRRR